MRLRMLGLLIFGLLTTQVGQLKADLVVNGGFENPVIPHGGVFVPYAAGSTAITSWTVASGTMDPGSGSVDLLSTFEPPHSGAQSLDGSGSPAAGGITQELTGLTGGATYILDFFYANNPNATSSSASVTVGDISEVITHSGSHFGSPDYTEAAYSSVATGSGTALTFLSTDPAIDVNGILLDDVSVVAASVPEPVSSLMLAFGIAALGVHMGARRLAA